MNIFDDVYLCHPRHLPKYGMYESNGWRKDMDHRRFDSTLLFLPPADPVSVTDDGWECWWELHYRVIMNGMGKMGMESKFISKKDRILAEGSESRFHEAVSSVMICLSG